MGAKEKLKLLRCWLGCAFGSACALLAYECAMHELAGRTATATGIEQRWYTEGIAHSHFALDGTRLTGAPPLPDALSVLIVGDSHVEANQVQDIATMGAELERQLRRSSERWNVLQYGWSGADVPDYIFEADVLMQRFRPDRVVVVLTSGDFAAVQSARVALREVNGRAVVEPVVRDASPGRPASYARPLPWIFRHSGLLYASLVRFTLDIRPRLAARRAGTVASATAVGAQRIPTLVKGLKEAYADRVLLLYVPKQPSRALEMPEVEERELLSWCASESIDCASLRSRMIEASTTERQLSRGFNNTAPGQGHLNEIGHRIAADAIVAWIHKSQ